MTASLLIVDDHQLLAQGLAAALTDRGSAAPTTIDPTQVDARSAIAASNPDLVLLDVDFGDNQRAGIELIAELVRQGRRVIMFTGINDPALYGLCLDLGAETVIRKAAPLDEVVGLLDHAVRGDDVGNDAERFGWYKAFRASETARAAALAPFEHLTERESCVLASLVDGMTVDEIAEASFVAVSTVRSQVRSIFQKLGVHSQLAAVALARRAQWQPPAHV